MVKVTQVDRIFKILEILNSGRTVCLTKNPISNQISLLEDLRNSGYEFEEVNVGLRALQKDMAYIKKYLGDNLSREGACYRLLKKEYLDNFFKDNHTEIKRFFHAISLIDKSVFGSNFKKYQSLLDTIKAQQKGVYLFLENPFENLKQLNLKEELERYIQERRYINIDYFSDKLYQFKDVQPYKIIYQNGNWYLAVLTTQDYEINGGFKLLRLNFIKNITLPKYEPYTFHENINVKYFLENRFQSLFTSYDREFFTVKVKVSSKVARHFKVKKYLKSQRIVEQTENNDLIIEYTINDEMEIIPIIQMWLPNLKVISPKWIDDKIIEHCKKYINLDKKEK